MKASLAPWILLVVSLPGATKAARMRLWRALRAGGAGALRDGVYALPASETGRAFFAQQAAQAITAGGSAQVIEFQSDGASQQQHLIGLFDRSADYAALLGRIHAQRASLPRRSSPRALAGLRREFEALAATDFFPGPAQAQVGSALLDLEVATTGGAAGEPHAQAGHIARRDSAAYRGRVWATRARPWVDRLASAWLIGRFIDPDARFRWLARPADRPKRAIGFDFDGAEFTHVGGKVSFEVLVASFDLDDDAALVRIGAIVNALDVGGAPAVEAGGLAAILRGLRVTIDDDDALLAAAAGVFDALYEGFAVSKETP